MRKVASLFIFFYKKLKKHLQNALRCVILSFACFRDKHEPAFETIAKETTA